MKRKTADSVASVIDVLNSFNPMEPHGIAEIRDKTGLPVGDINEALKVISLIDRFAPEMAMDDANGTFTILGNSKHVDSLPNEEGLLLHLFRARAFDEASARHDVARLLNGVTTDGEFIVFVDGADPGFYLTTRGKFRAQGILASVHGDAGKLLDGP